MFIHFYVVYVGHFMNTFVFFGLFWLSAQGSRLVRLLVAPALSKAQIFCAL